MLKTSFSSISLARSGSSMSPRLAVRLSAATLLLVGDASGSLGLARWLSIPPEPMETDPGAEDEGGAMIGHRTVEAEVARLILTMAST